MGSCSFLHDCPEGLVKAVAVWYNTRRSNRRQGAEGGWQVSKKGENMRQKVKEARNVVHD